METAATVTRVNLVGVLLIMLAWFTMPDGPLWQRCVTFLAAVAAGVVLSGEGDREEIEEIERERRTRHDRSGWTSK